MGIGSVEEKLSGTAGGRRSICGRLASPKQKAYLMEDHTRVSHGRQTCVDHLCGAGAAAASTSYMNLYREQHAK